MTTDLSHRQPLGGDIATMVQGAADRLVAALPAHFTAEKMAQVVSILAHKNPDLMKCERESLITSIITGGSLGLDFTPSMGEAWLIPRWNKKLNDGRGGYECTFQPGYQGLVKLARQTGLIAFMQARPVYQGDQFEYWYDPDLRLVHKPSLTGERGYVTHIYCLVKFADGNRIVECMTADEVEEIHRRSDGYKKAQEKGWEERGPWVSDWTEMGKKTVLKRTCKSLDRTTDPERFARLAQAIDHDNRQYEADDGAPAHHAVHHGNGTGHGRTGAYAAPEVVADYRVWARDFVRGRDTDWADAVSRAWPADRPLPAKFGEVMNGWQLTNHLFKFARERGWVNAPPDAKQGQKPGFLGVAWERYRGEIQAEAARYVDAVWAEKRELMDGEMESQEPPVAPEDESQDMDPDDDIDYPPLGDAAE